MNTTKNKKDSRIYNYFSTCATNSYLDGEKLQRDFIKNSTRKFKIPAEICRRELRKARIRLYHRLAYLKQNKKVIYLAKMTGLNGEKLIKLILRGDIEITKNGINRFINVFYLVQSSLEDKELAEQNENGNKQKETLTEIFDLDIDNFIARLAFMINKINVKNQYIKAIELQDSVFFSIISLSNLLSGIIGAYVPDFKINIKTKQKILILLVDEFRKRSMLAVNINEGFYSNSVLIYGGINKKSKKAHGIFLRKSIFEGYYIDPKPVGFENIKIILAKI